MTSDFSDNTASIHLDYGADSAPFDFSSLHICPRGMRLRTRWFFEQGTELSVNFQVADSDGGCSGRGRILKTEGVVVECRPMDDGDPEGDGYEVTMGFLEVTDDILAAIRDVLPTGALLEE